MTQLCCVIETIEVHERKNKIKMKKFRPIVNRLWKPGNARDTYSKNSHVFRWGVWWHYTLPSFRGTWSNHGRLWAFVCRRVFHHPVSCSLSRRQKRCGSRISLPDGTCRVTGSCTGLHSARSCPVAKSKIIITIIQTTVWRINAELRRRSVHF